MIKSYIHSKNLSQCHLSFCARILVLGWCMLHANHAYSSGVPDFLRQTYEKYIGALMQTKKWHLLPQKSIEAKVAVLNIIDPIEFGYVASMLLMIEKDHDMRGIILIINSNGGDASLFSMVHDILKKVKIKKPIVCLVIGNALSGGYLLASASDYIIAHRFSSLGGIGIVRQIATYKNPKIDDVIVADLEVETFTQGDFKHIGSEYVPLSEQDRDHIKKDMAKFYQEFLTIIIENRNVSEETSSVWANGKTFIAQEALSLNLIDEIGTYFEAEKRIVELLRQKYPHLVFSNHINPLFM